jgi:hypothetical protein
VGAPDADPRELRSGEKLPRRRAAIDSAFGIAAEAVRAAPAVGVEPDASDRTSQHGLDAAVTAELLGAPTQDEQALRLVLEALGELAAPDRTRPGRGRPARARGPRGPVLPREQEAS